MALAFSLNIYRFFVRLNLNFNRNVKRRNLNSDFTRKPRVTTGKPMQCAANGLYSSSRGDEADGVEEGGAPTETLSKKLTGNKYQI
jgi:hypothetical protein